MPRIVEVTNLLQKDSPSIQFYWNGSRSAIGYWNHTLGRVQVLVSELINGAWAPMPELLINGEPCFKPEDWTPCRYEDLTV